MAMWVDSHRLGGDGHAGGRDVWRIHAVLYGENYLAVSRQNVDRTRGRDLEQIGPQGDIEVAASIQGQATRAVVRRVSQPQSRGPCVAAAASHIGDPARATAGNGVFVSLSTDDAHGVIVAIDVVDSSSRSDRRPFRAHENVLVLGYGRVRALQTVANLDQRAVLIARATARVHHDRHHIVRSGAAAVDFVADDGAGAFIISRSRSGRSVCPGMA